MMLHGRLLLPRSLRWRVRKLGGGRGEMGGVGRRHSSILCDKMDSVWKNIDSSRASHANTHEYGSMFVTSAIDNVSLVSVLSRLVSRRGSKSCVEVVWSHPCHRPDANLPFCVVLRTCYRTMCGFALQVPSCI